MLTATELKREQIRRERVEAIERQIAAISREIRTRAEAPALTWAQIGDLGEVAAQVQEIARFLGLEEE